MLNGKKTAENLINVCRHLYEKGFVSATDGNVSVRLETGTFLTTRTGINKGMVTSEDIIEVNTSGNVVSGSYNPSTELAMHLYIYLQRQDVNAVVHAHPPYATGFATARQPLTGCLYPEVIVGFGAIPLAEYATPSTIEVIKSIEPFVNRADAILLANHGVVTYGKDLLDAYFKMEKVEHAAHITFVARMLGGEKLLSKEDVEKLKAISIESYGKDFTEKIACKLADKKTSQTETEDDIRKFIRKILNKED
jgi:L-fuculose-phosphate aldolase